MSISPINNTQGKVKSHVLKQAINNKSLNTSVIEQEATKDTLQISKKSNKKKALAFAGIAGAIAFTGGIMHLIKHSTLKAPKEVKGLEKEIESIKTSTSKVAREMQKKFEEVTSIFKKVQEQSYQGNAKINNNILEEFNENNELIRKSTFNDKFLDIVEFKPDGKFDKYSFINGEPSGFRKNVIKTADRNFQWDESANFDYGKLSGYTRNLKYTENSMQRDIIIEFIDGKPLIFEKGHQSFADKSEKYISRLEFIDGKPSIYEKGCEHLTDDTWKYNSRFEFKKNQWEEIK